MLTGKNAIVTGSTSGIGLAIAETLAANGVNVTLNGLEDAKEIAALQKRLADEHGVEIRYSAANMLHRADIKSMVDDAQQAFGTIDILVNNAGIQHVAPVDEFPADKWDAIIAINLSAVFHATAAVLPGMKARQFGRIINIASAHALVASPFKAAYIAAKHGVAGLTKTVALEVAELGITVNAIAPGYVLTPLVEKQIPATAKTRNMAEEDVIRDVMLAGQPTKRFVGTDEIGALAVFLCGDNAVSITGTIMPVDGGWTAQ